MTALASACATTWAALAVPPTVVSTGQGPVAIATGGLAARELSGVAWTGGSEFLAVGDNGVAELWRLDVAISPTSGQIASASVVGAVPMAGIGSDAEGVAFLPARGSALVSDESLSVVREFRIADGALVGTLAVPTIYLAPNLRSNLGLESLGARDGTVWTSNEEALVSDGPVSTTAAGTLVRLQRFSPGFVASGQWAYRTDPISAMTPLVDLERSGVVDLVPIGPTRALVLEREFGGPLVPDFRSRIYAIDVAGADDVSTRGSLAKGGFTPVAKTLLWQGDFPLANFEGMTIGPRLDDGCLSLVLVSDDGSGASGQQNRLLALRLCGVAACDADLDATGDVGAGDLAELLAAWATAGAPADLDGDGVVAAGDLAALLGAWGVCGPG